MAERIKLRLRRTAEDIIEIGKDLLAVKDRLMHGQFLPWLEAEFGMLNVTASRFMNVAQVYGSKSFTVKDIEPTALYELAAPKTPRLSARSYRQGGWRLSGGETRRVRKLRTLAGGTSSRMTRAFPKHPVTSGYHGIPSAAPSA